jgi:hypothetical protein
MAGAPAAQARVLPAGPVRALPQRHAAGVHQPFTGMLATVAVRNVNNRIGVYYDQVDVSVQYKNMAIIVPARLPVHY